MCSRSMTISPAVEPVCCFSPSSSLWPSAGSTVQIPTLACCSTFRHLCPHDSSFHSIFPIPFSLLPPFPFPSFSDHLPFSSSLLCALLLLFSFSFPFLSSFSVFISSPCQSKLSFHFLPSSFLGSFLYLVCTLVLNSLFFPFFILFSIFFDFPSLHSFFLLWSPLFLFDFYLLFSFL